MPGTYFGPFSEKDNNYPNSGNANVGRWPLGHILVLPDKREYYFGLNDGTVEVAGNLYQAVASVANHIDVTADVARAIGATVISATLGATAALVDIYAEGTVHSNNDTGEAYAHRIRRANTAGDAHAAAATSSILTVNLQADESVQVALDTSSEVTFTRNRFHQITIHLGPPTARLAGVSPGVAAADRFYWSQVKGYAAVLAQGTLLEGLPVQADITTNGAVENYKRRIRTGGASVAATAAAAAQLPIMNQDGVTTDGAFLGVTSTTLSTATFDITGPVSHNAPIVGMCVQPNSTAQYALIDLDIT